MKRDELRARALSLHRRYEGKWATCSKVRVKTPDDLSLAYTPGVAEPCKKIDQDPDAVYAYTNRGNLVGVVTDGSAVLGLGNIGPYAAYPVMEGKCVLFKTFGGLDAVPICLNTQEVDAIVEHVLLLEPTFGGINLEDIASPRCFEIERQLKEKSSIPIFHDDQHGTAVVVAAALLNAAKLAEKEMKSLRVVINGAGAAGLATARLLLELGVEALILCDRDGALYEGFPGPMNPEQALLAKQTNPERCRGHLSEVLPGADVFIGLSAGGVLTSTMVRSMAPRSIVFAMANPEPEIYPEDARMGGAWITATGRSDFPNQINNVLAFPGIMAGALGVRASDITASMKRSAAQAIADCVSEEALRWDHVIPEVFDPDVAPAVAQAVARSAIAEGIQRLERDPRAVADRVRQRVLGFNDRRCQEEPDPDQTGLPPKR